RLDAYDSEVGGQALSRLYYKLIDFIRFFFKKEKNKICEKDVHLFCHSMGAMVLKNMMLYLKKSENINKDPIYEVFKEIILVAPDVSADIFEQGNAFDNLLSLGNRVHIYGHKNDVALKISGKIHQVERLGGIIDPMRLNLPSNAFYVNAAQGTKSDWQGIKDEAISHWYHYNSQNIITDINRVLDGGNSQYYL
ncbi:MAG: alpha/beta hydrolase, partial [Bacteroidota bacterium]